MKTMKQGAAKKQPRGAAAQVHRIDAHRTTHRPQLAAGKHQILKSMKIGTAKKQVLQSIAGEFPCNALLHKWGKVPSNECAKEQATPS